MLWCKVLRRGERAKAYSNFIKCLLGRWLKQYIILIYIFNNLIRQALLNDKLFNPAFCFSNKFETLVSRDSILPCFPCSWLHSAVCSFVWIYIYTWYEFPSSGKTSFNIAGSVSLLAPFTLWLLLRFVLSPSRKKLSKSL